MLSMWLNSCAQAAHKAWSAWVQMYRFEHTRIALFSAVGINSEVVRGLHTICTHFFPQQNVLFNRFIGHLSLLSTEPIKRVIILRRLKTILLIGLFQILSTSRLTYKEV